MADEDELSCVICSEIYTDPRVLPCGHSFCSDCIVKWRQTQPVCPNCRGPIGEPNPPRNTILANIVERYLQQQQPAEVPTACEKCGRPGADLRVCQHCRHPLCPECTGKHVQKLRTRANEAMNRVEPLLKRKEDRMDSLLTAQASWTQSQAYLSAALAEVNRRVEAINREVSQRSDLIHSSRERLTAMQASMAAVKEAQDAGLFGRTIKDCNVLVHKLGIEESNSNIANGGASNFQSSLLDATSVELDELVYRLAACFHSNNEQQQPVVQQQPNPLALVPGPADRAMLSEYYSKFPQRYSNYFSIVGSIVGMAVCWNTRGYLYGRGKIMSAEAVNAAGDQAAFRELPDEIILILEGVPPHTKVKVYDIVGGLKGNIEMRMPDGNLLNDAPSYSIAVNSTTQLVSVSIPKCNQVLVTTLDGTYKLLVSSCQGLALDNPLGVWLTDAGEVYIADFRNRRVCCIDCETGQVVRVFEHNSLARVDRIIVAEDGTVLARVEPCHLVILNPNGPLPSRLREIKRQFFHFYLDPFGSLVFSSGGGTLTGQLFVIRQPLLESSGNPEEIKLISWPDVKYSCVACLRNGQVLASAANKKEIHFY